MILNCNSTSPPVERPPNNTVRSMSAFSNSSASNLQETLFQGRFLRVVREGRWEYVQRIHSADAVIIVGLTVDDRVLLIEQHRIPIHGNVIEFPAGIVGDDPRFPNEPLADAARRELLEETGYAAERLIAAFSGTCSAGLTDECVTFFVATGLTKIAPGGGVDGENLTLHEVPRAEIHEWIRARIADGTRIDARLFTGLYWLEDRLRGLRLANNR